MSPANRYFILLTGSNGVNRLSVPIGPKCRRSSEASFRSFVDTSETPSYLARIDYEEVDESKK